MNKSQLAYLSGITFVSIGLIPITRSIFSIELFNDAPIFFLSRRYMVPIDYSFLIFFKRIPTTISNKRK